MPIYMLIANKDNIKGSYISYFSNLVKAYGGINLAQGIPGFEPPAKLLEILAETKSQKAHQYAPGTGNLQLLERLQIMYSGSYDPSVAEFCIVNGATEAISLIYTWLNKKLGNDLKSLAFSPAYESYIHLPGIFGNEVMFQKLDEQGVINIAELEENIQRNHIRLVFLSSPGNPWGVITGKDSLEAVCDICERNRCYLIIDAVYRELYFSEEPPWYPTLRMSEYLFYVNSFSKLFSITGWRVGYLLAHHSNMEGLKHVHDYIGLSSPAPLQAALAVFLEEDLISKHYIQDLRAIIGKNFYTQSAKLVRNSFMVPRHDGGYFIWAKCPAPFLSGVDFAVDLYNRKQIAVIPGAHFGNQFDPYIRINIAMPTEKLNEGIEGICTATSEV